MSADAVLKRVLTAPERNVGGGDLLTRMLAALALLVLAGMITPQAQVSFPLLKISLLFAAELGLMSLMLGLFLNSKTYFAGLQLLVAPLLMLWLVGHRQPWLAIVAALIFVGVGITSVLTRRSRLNALLHLSSLRVPLQEVTHGGSR